MPRWLFCALTGFYRSIQRFQHLLGTALTWLSAAMVITVSLVVALRELLGIGSIATQESVAYMHATLFMLTLAYTAQAGGHVRVDIFYRKFSVIGKAWVDLLGSLLLLLPFALFLFFTSLSMVEQSWQLREGSIHPGGLPFVYLLKSLIPTAAFLVALHALADIAQKLLQISLADDEGTEHA